MKIILNKCHGAFSVSPAGCQLYAKKRGFKLYPYVIASDPENKYDTSKYYLKKVEIGEHGRLSYHYLKEDYGDKVSRKDFEEIEDDYVWFNQSYRTDPFLIEVVEELGKEASGAGSDLKVVEIPDDMEWVIDVYDGLEVLHQKVQTW